MNSLNLLPAEKKTALRRGLLLIQTQRLTLVLFLLSVLIAAFLFSIRMELGGTLADLTASADDHEQDEVDIAGIVTETNRHLRLLSDRASASVAWSRVLADIAAAAPPGIALERITAGPSRAISIRGVAPTRDEVLAMRRALENNPSFIDVSSPLSNILQRTNVNFEFELKYRP